MSKKEGAAAVGIHIGETAVSYEPPLAADNKTPVRGADQGAWDHSGYNPKYIVTVGQENAQYMSIEAAFAAILLGTHGNVPALADRYLIQIGPGDFPIAAQIAYNGYISLMGAGVGETLLVGDMPSPILSISEGEVDLDGLIIENLSPVGETVHSTPTASVTLRLGTKKLMALKSTAKNILIIDNADIGVSIILAEAISLNDAAYATYSYYPYPSINSVGIRPPIVARLPDALPRRQNTRPRQSVVGISPVAFHRNYHTSNWQIDGPYCYGTNMPFRWITTGVDPGVDPLAVASNHLLVCDLAQFIPYGAALESIQLKFASAAAPGGEIFTAFIVGTHAAEDTLGGANGWLNSTIAAAPTVDVLASGNITAGAAGVQMLEIVPMVSPRTFEQLAYAAAVPISFRHPAVRENIIERLTAAPPPYITSDFFGMGPVPVTGEILSEYASVMLVVHCDETGCAFDGAVATFSSTLPDNLYIAANPL